MEDILARGVDPTTAISLAEVNIPFDLRVTNVDDRCYLFFFVFESNTPPHNPQQKRVLLRKLKNAPKPL